jgi:hypothetical protein
MMHPFVSYFQQQRYLLLLVALLALLVVQPIAATFGIMEALFDALLVFVMAVLLLGLAKGRIWRIVACILCIPASALSVGSHFLTSTAHDVSLSAGHAIGALFFVVVAGKIVASIFSALELTWDSLFGAICGYLLLGVAWGLTYAMIYAANPNSFQLSDAIRPYLEEADYMRNVFIYYSFVTLTTVGYGDVTAVSIPARTLSWGEAITGQLYLAVLIAGLISSLVARNATRDCQR